MSEHIWMEHAEHKGRAMLPDLPYWRAAGWEPCDGPPPEPDLTRDAAMVEAQAAAANAEFERLFAEQMEADEAKQAEPVEDD